LSAEFRIGFSVPEEHVPVGGVGCGFTAVHRKDRTVGKPYNEKPTPADTGVERIHHAHGESGGHGGIDGVASFFQDVQTDGAGLRVRGNDHALFSCGRSNGGMLRRRASGQ
jgi:hypothetical protein